MRLPNSTHEALPWRIHEITRDFRLEDVWALPVSGREDEFPKLVEVIGSLDPTATTSSASRALFDLRHRLGRCFGWDDAACLPIPGSTDTTLKDRLPRDLCRTTDDLEVGSVGLEKLGVHFAPLYVTDRESAAETSNRTVHGVLHLGWVDAGRGRYQGRMAIYVKPRGALGQAYMALIRPFRYWVVYPALMHEIGKAWKIRQARWSPAVDADKPHVGAKGTAASG